MQDFPATHALRALEAAGVTHVVVHGAADSCVNVAALEPVAATIGLTIYRLRPELIGR